MIATNRPAFKLLWFCPEVQYTGTIGAWTCSLLEPAVFLWLCYWTKHFRLLYLSTANHIGKLLWCNLDLFLYMKSPFCVHNLTSLISFKMCNKMNLSGRHIMQFCFNGSNLKPLFLQLIEFGWHFQLSWISCCKVRHQKWSFRMN